ncbi:MAG: response regulator [Thiotrichales bacterium]|nr:response regulator [Thiotrichales bacterium]
MSITTKPQVVIVEDEFKIAQILIDYLNANDYQPIHFENGEGVVAYVKNHSVDCVLLDVMLPNANQFGDGLQLCKAIRQLSQVPIMMLTARIEEIDRILGLELGADDYICKPFSPREVMARIKALLRRSQMQADLHVNSQDRDHLSAHSDALWQLDEGRFQLHYQAQHLDLTSVEFEIMRTLSSSPGHIFSRSQLIEKIYSDHRIVSDRTVDSHIKKLRQKLNGAFGEQEWIHSVYGVGYKFVMGL